jgi:drug/metabolite transporter (DMT)-like permease
LPPGVYGAAFYLALTCTVLAYLGQTWAQARTTPTRTAIILSMEPVFAALFAWFWLGEKMGMWGWMGAGSILAGILLAELGPFLRRKSEIARNPKS